MSPERIVKAMMQNDHFSQWMGVELIECNQGSCKLEMVIRIEMCNGFGITHGGILFSMADSAMAFASNTRGRKTVSVETSISYLKEAVVNDRLIVIAKEQHLSHHFGRYKVKIEKKDRTKVALFNGTVYRKDEEWLL